MQQELIATIAATSEALAVESRARVEMRKVIIPIESRTMLVRWTRKREIERNVSYEILRVHRKGLGATRHKIVPTR